MKLWGKFTSLVAGAAVAAVLSTPAAAQQTGSVTGLVMDATSSRTLESAQVFAPSLPGVGGLTNRQGRFLILNFPVGTHELRVELIGYTAASAQVTVTAGESTTQDFRLESTALRLQEIVVTGVAGETPRVKLPFTVERVDFTELPVPAPSADGLLQGKAPGVKVVQGSGQPGSDGSIILRGPTTITGTQSPLLIIDGVITEGTLADISSLDIESIEIVKGAAGASLYGSRAQNGVVQIRTKRGTGLGVDQSRITFRNEYGINDLEGSIPISQRHPFLQDAQGNILGYFPGQDQSGAPQPIDIRRFYSSRDGEVGQTCERETDPIGEFCAPFISLLNGGGTVETAFQNGTYPSEYQLFDQVDALFDPGRFYNGYAAVEGRTGSTNYRASFTHQTETGIVDLNDGFRLNGFRLNLDHQVLDNLNASITTYYSRSRIDDVIEGGGGSAFYSITFQAPFADLRRRVPETAGGPCPAEGCFVFFPDPQSQETNPLYNLDTEDRQDTRQRFQGSANITYSPLSWLEIEGVFGLDQASFLEEDFIPEGLLSDQSGVGLGSIRRRQLHRNDMNASLTASANRAWGDLTTRTLFRWQYEDRTTRDFFATGTDFIAFGVPRIDNTDPLQLDAGSDIQEIRAEYLIFSNEFDYQGKYIGDFLYRRDGASQFGEEERFQDYYRFSGAWRMAQEDWWSIDAIDEFKIRYSLGTAGGVPRFEAQYETYDVQQGSIAPETLGNRFLRPEISTEQELGLDMVLFGRFATGLTYAWSRVEDQLLEVPLPGFAGFDEQWQNAGTLEASTIEAFLETEVIQTPDFGWNTRVNFDRTRQEITELNMAPFQRGFFWVREGEVLGTFYGQRWASTCSELPAEAQSSCDQFQVNDDGLLVWTGAGNSYQDGISGDLWGDETEIGGNRFKWGHPIRTVTESDGDFNFMGDTNTSFNLSWANTFRWKNLSLYTLLDGEFGADIYNQTRQWAYRDNRSGDQDQIGKSDAQLKPISYYQDLYNTNQESSWFVEDGTFVKIREAALSYRFNQDTVDRLFGGTLSGLSLNIIGRNLLTFTDFVGFDPEVGITGQNTTLGSEAVSRVANFGYPNFRTFSASLEIIF